MGPLSTELDHIKEYYGKVLRGRRDLRANVCCSKDSVPPKHQKIVEMIDAEILSRSYGCGSPIPPDLEGRTVLDLGCGTGRDVYVASYLAGESGQVIGVDMTDEQLGVAVRHLDAQMARFGYRNPNVTFKKGYIEDLKAIGIDDDSVDVVISNCVINLSPDKRAVFSEIFRVLKPGGELHISDVFAGRRVPPSVRSDPVLYGECLGGALYIEDFRRILRDVGCVDYRVVSRTRLELEDPVIRGKAGMVDFHSMTIRAFKLNLLEDICEDYGQMAVYKGTIPDAPHEFSLDDHHTFVTGKPVLVCGNTAAMLEETRYARHFVVTGDRSVHYGAFTCGSTESKRAGGILGSGGACC